MGIGEEVVLHYSHMGHTQCQQQALIPWVG